jgi:hypothetical protein
VSAAVVRWDLAHGGVHEQRDLKDMSLHRPDRPGPCLLYLAAATAALAFHAVWIRPQMLTWGATPDETVRPYPGDELVPDPDGGATMATTLPAPPERVWRWLVQMGGDRAGWYSWDRLDNNGRPSANRIVPEWQGLKQGQHLARVSAPGNKGPSWFTVEVLEPNRTLVLHSTYGMFSGLSFDPSSGPVPWAYVDGSWGFYLRATPSGGTREAAAASLPWVSTSRIAFSGVAMRTIGMHGTRSSICFPG